MDLALDTGDACNFAALHVANLDVLFLLTDWKAARYACSETVRLDHLLVRFVVVLLASCASYVAPIQANFVLIMVIRAHEIIGRNFHDCRVLGCTET